MGLAGLLPLGCVAHVCSLTIEDTQSCHPAPVTGMALRVVSSWSGASRRLDGRLCSGYMDAQLYLLSKRVGPRSSCHQKVTLLSLTVFLSLCGTMVIHLDDSFLCSPGLALSG